MMRWPHGETAEAAAQTRVLAGLRWPPVLSQAMPVPLRIVDVGALTRDQPEHYQAIARFHHCEVVGFEPQNDGPVTLHEARMTKTVLPVAVGDGRPARFHRTRFAAASSLLPPNHALLQAFCALPDMLAVDAVAPIDTVRLDDVAEISDCDLLKLDVQGGELDVLRGAERLLQRVPMIITEVEFAPLYAGQPLFADIDVFLRGHGFELLGFLDGGADAYRAGQFGHLKGRLTWADAVYVRDDEGLRHLGPDKILKAFMVAHHALLNPSYAAHLLALHDSLCQGALLEAYTSLLHYAHHCVMAEPS